MSESTDVTTDPNTSPAWEQFAALPDEEQALQVLQMMMEVVNAFGFDHVYNPGSSRVGMCYYVVPADGSDDWSSPLCPSCIVGQVVSRFGLPLPAMLPGNSDQVDLCTWAQQLGPKTLAILRAAQRVQDAVTRFSHHGVPKTWGHALLAAEAVYTHVMGY